MSNKKPVTLNKIKLIHQLEEMAINLDGGCQLGEIPDSKIKKAQGFLNYAADNLVEDSNDIDSRLYIIYENQAILHWIYGEEEKAIEFAMIAKSIIGNGDLLTKTGNDLIEITNSENAKINNSKVKKDNLLYGLKGWLALFIVGQFFSLLLSIYNLINSEFFLSTSAKDIYNQYQYGLGDTLNIIIIFETIAQSVYIILIISTLVLLFYRSKLAKSIVIAMMLFSVIYGLIDYSIVNSIFNSSDLIQNTEIQASISQAAKEIGRSISAALLWIPYFLVSKRVKQTLINK